MVSHAPAVVSLDQALAQDPSLVGNKAALLAAARAAGLPVAHAWCVTAQVYRELVLPRHRVGAALEGLAEIPLPPALSAQLECLGRAHAPVVVRRSRCGHGLADRPEAWHERPPRVACGVHELRQALVDIWLQGAVLDPSAAAHGVGVLLSPKLEACAAGRALGCTPGAPAGTASTVEAVDAQDTARFSAVLGAGGEILRERGAISGLTGQHLATLLKWLERCHAVLGGPAQITWLLVDDQLFLTGLSPQRVGLLKVEHLGARAPGVELWSDLGLRQRIGQPLGPLALSVWRRHLVPPILEAVTGLPYHATRQLRIYPLDLVSGRLYWNLNRLRAIPSGTALIALARHFDAEAAALLEVAQRRTPLTPTPLASLRKLWALVYSVAGYARLLARGVSGLRGGSALQYYRAFTSAQRQGARQALEELTGAELMARADQVGEDCQRCARHVVAHAVIRSLVALWLRRTGAAVAALESPLRLPTRALEEGELGDDFDGFDDLGSVDQGVAPEAAAPPPWPLGRRGLFVLSTLRPLAERALGAGLLHLRRIYLRCGQVLHERGLLRTPGDVWFLSADELRDLLESVQREPAQLRAEVDARRHEHRRHYGSAPPRVVRSDGRPVELD